eukprot:scaffold1143_cov177-Amphora_coffeaeformis.AAC.12
MMMLLALLSFFLSFPIVTTSFLTPYTTTSHRVRHARCDASSSSSSSSSLSMVVVPVVDPSLWADGTVAMVASFAAGVLTQVPRVQALERNVTATTAAAAAQMQEYQDKLYALDQEYEQGTQALKEQFEALRETQLRRQKRQLAQDFEYKLQAQVTTLKETYERQLKEQRSEWLAQQLEQLGDMTGADRQAELMTLRIQQEQWQERNQKLAVLLEESKQQIDELKKNQRGNGAGWMSFFK